MRIATAALRGCVGGEAMIRGGVVRILESALERMGMSDVGVASDFMVSRKKAAINFSLGNNPD
jgi:hypothetical protein